MDTILYHVIKCKKFLFIFCSQNGYRYRQCTLNIIKFNTDYHYIYNNNNNNNIYHDCISNYGLINKHLLYFNNLNYIIPSNNFKIDDIFDSNNFIVTVQVLIMIKSIKQQKMIQ